MKPIPTYPFATLATTVGPNGITAPSFEDTLLSIIATYQSIYGADVFLDASAQDMQWLAAVAQIVYDCNQMQIAVYNQFSPATAQGTGLSSVVKVNGITRAIPTSSTAVVTVGGVAGTTIINGAIGDNVNLGTIWVLPPSVIIPALGSIAVTATSTVPGAVAAAPGSLTVIRTPVAGWQTVTNPSGAVPGQILETDVALRRRQTASTAIPSQTVLAGIIGSLEALTGVTGASADENVGSAPDANAVPGHSVAFVVQGGSVQAIVDTIGAKKTIGTGTAGTTSGTFIDQAGIPHAVTYYTPTLNTISVSIHLTALLGYTTLVGTKIQQAVASYISGLGIGGDVLISRLYVPANLFGPTANPASPGDTLTYDITSIQAAISPGSPGNADVIIAFNAVAVCAPSNVTLVVT